MTDIQNCKISGMKQFWREYYIETIGNITDEAVKKYIKEQEEVLMLDWATLESKIEQENKILESKYGNDSIYRYM